MLVALAGFCHLFGGQPSLNADDRVEGLSDAGGLVGLAIAAPLESIAWIFGATIVLAAVAFLGAVMFIGIPVRDAVGIVRRSLASIGAALGGALQSLFTLGRERDDADSGRRRPRRRRQRRGHRPA